MWDSKLTHLCITDTIYEEEGQIDNTPVKPECKEYFVSSSAIACYQYRQ